MKLSKERLTDLGHTEQQIKQLSVLLRTTPSSQCCGGCGGTLARPTTDSRGTVYAIGCYCCGNPDVYRY